MSFICHIHNYTEYNEEWNVFSAFNPSKCTYTLEQWAADIAAPGEQLGVRCLAQGSHLSHGHFLPEPLPAPVFLSQRFTLISSVHAVTKYNELLMSHLFTSSSFPLFIGTSTILTSLHYLKITVETQTWGGWEIRRLTDTQEEIVQGCQSENPCSDTHGGVRVCCLMWHGCPWNVWRMK